MITPEIKGLNIVLLTENLDTNYFDQHFFTWNKIYTLEEMTSGSVFMPGLSKVESEDSILAIFPKDIRFILKTNDSVKSYESIKRRLKRFVESLPLIPVKAIGMNAVWKIIDSDESLHHICKQLFYNPTSRIFSYFESEDSMYGTYLSKDFDYCTRLKLDIKPMRVPSGDSYEELLMASFNYHRDLDSQRWKDQIGEQLNKWSNILANSKKIICSLM